MQTKRHFTRQLPAAIAMVAIVAFCGVAFASSATAPAKRAEVLAKQVAALVAVYESDSRAAVAVSAVDLRAEKPLLAMRDAELLIPASNQKILTSAFILARLGGDSKFVTSVFRRGDDVVVVGGYDPTLGDPVLAEQSGKGIYDELDRWAAGIRRSFGETIKGDILLSLTAGEEPSRHPAWQKSDRRKWYGAPVSEINFHDNCFDVYFRAEGDKALPVVAPRSRFIRVASEVKLGGRNIWSLRTADDESVVMLTGTATGKGSWPYSVAVDNPPLLLGRVLADRLAAASVELAGTIKAVGPPSTLKGEMTHLCGTSTPLETVMARSNKRSLNLAAECMFLRAGDGTWRGSAKLMGETLVKSYGLAGGSMEVSDGGGLSRHNRVTAAAMTRVLTALTKRQDAEVFLNSLPVAGVDGTLQTRMAQADCRGRVAAKTGYISGVSALSGYVLDKAGKPAVAFAIIANNVPAGKAHEAKGLQDEICRAIVNSLAR